MRTTTGTTVKMSKHPIPESIRTASTEQLFIIWDYTTTAKPAENVFIIRGWLMDEIEERLPAAFDAWISKEACTDEDLKKYVEANAICYDCKKFLNDCAGTTNKHFTGCIFREV